jgi:hypothetical protein
MGDTIDIEALPDSVDIFDQYRAPESLLDLVHVRKSLNVRDGCALPLLHQLEQSRLPCTAAYFSSEDANARSIRMTTSFYRPHLHVVLSRRSLVKLSLAMHAHFTIQALQDIVFRSQPFTSGNTRTCTMIITGSGKAS